MAIKALGRKLSDAELNAPDLDEGEHDVETYLVPDGMDIEDSYLRAVWQEVAAAMNGEVHLPEAAPPTHEENLTRILESLLSKPAPQPLMIQPNITVNVPERSVTVAAAEVNVPPANVTVNIPEQAAPVTPPPIVQVDVHPPAAAPPVVNVQIPEPKPVEFRIARDAQGKMEGGTIEPSQ